MRVLKVRFAGIITKHNAPDVHRIGESLSTWFAERKIKTELNSIHKDMDMLVILGGDGTLLHVADQASHLDIPVVGINLGNLGFLTEIAADEMYQALETILAGEVHIEERMMLQATLVSGKDQKKRQSWIALNEVVIVKGNMERMVRLRCWSGEEYITTYRADGLIISTPTGSTAYNLSAGGPIVQAELKALLVTPICPFMLESRPVLLAPETEVTIQVAGPVYDVKVLVDGRFAWDIEENDYLVIKAAAKPLCLISSPHKGYFAILRKKLNWGGRDTEHDFPGNLVA